MEKRTETGYSLKRLLLSRFYSYIEEDRSDKLHVTDLVYRCPRRVYYYKRHPEIALARYDEQSIITLATGKKLHEIPLAPVDMSGYEVAPWEKFLETEDAVKRALAGFDPGEVQGFHELPVAYYRGMERQGNVQLREPGEEPLVTGRIDEFVYLPGDGWVLLDKKTTVHTPRSPYEHHLLQISIYARLVELNYGLVPDKLAMVYVNISDKTVEVFEEDYKPNRQAIDLLLRGAEDLWASVQSGRLPEARPGWVCKYCPYHSLCLLDKP